MDFEDQGKWFARFFIVVLLLAIGLLGLGVWGFIELIGWITSK